MGIQTGRKLIGGGAPCSFRKVAEIESASWQYSYLAIMQKTSKKECGTASDVDETDLGRPNTHQASAGIVSDVPQSANRKKKASRSLNRGWEQ